MSFDNSINTLCLLFCVSCLGNLIRKLSSLLFTYQSYLFIFFNQHYRKIVKFRWKQDSSLVSYWLRRSSAQNVQASSWTIIFPHKNGTAWKDSLRILQFTAKAFDCSGTWFPWKRWFRTKFAYILHLWTECIGPCILYLHSNMVRHFNGSQFAGLRCRQYSGNSDNWFIAYATIVNLKVLNWIRFRVIFSWLPKFY